MTGAVTKAVIPAAGRGTRFLPVTRAVPKEMLPIVDTPVIDFVVEEAVRSGLTDILIVTGPGKEAIETYFDRSRPDSQIRYTLQEEARGLGDAVGCARAFTGDDPFVVLLGDAIIDAEPPAAAQLVACHERYAGSVVSVEDVPRERVSRYGIVSGTPLDDRTTRLTGLVEKPAPAESPSTLAIAGRYLLTPSFYAALDETEPGLGGEVQITDALDRLAKREPMFAWRCDGVRLDVGDKLDWVRAQIEYALARDAFREPLLRYLRSLLRARPEAE